MGNERFYGAADAGTVSYLEFGSIDMARGCKNVYGFKLHQKAYDWFMLARYGNEIAAFTQLREALKTLDAGSIRRVLAEELHHPNTLTVYLWMLCALGSLQEAEPSRPARFLEVGQTLFGCIDGLEFLQEFLGSRATAPSAPRPRDIRWRGMDISGLFNTLARRLHPEYDVKTSTRLEDFPDRSGLFFAKGVTLHYCAQNAPDLLDLLTRSELALFDYSFCLDGGRRRSIGTGKQVVHVGLDAFIKLHEATGRALYVSQERDFHPQGSRLVFLNCLSGPRQVCEAVVRKDAEARRGLRDAGLEDMFPSLRPGGLEWMPWSAFTGKQHVMGAGA